MGPTARPFVVQERRRGRGTGLVVAVCVLLGIFGLGFGPPTTFQIVVVTAIGVPIASLIAARRRYVAQSRALHITHVSVPPRHCVILDPLGEHPAGRARRNI